MARVRVHQHVNPLSPYYRQEPDPVDLSAVFANPALPLHLDIGSARGRFLLRMAQAEPDTNYLGIEIREPLVDEANQIRDAMGLHNLHYVFSNAMIWLDRLLADIPDGVLKMVSIHFPDPWFKNKHAKRRMVNRELAETVANKLDAGGMIFVQTDIEFLAEEMFALFRAHGRLMETAVDVSPFPVKTEREKAVEIKGLPVYRRLFRT
ncbi:MAG TPA: tRNA (guanosine(46)-N7)-methyltransferase TrmB [Pyrinomonadaceae bacterium]|nr:tRNA (guanosine(46)-N7)-methyltransferase TrmB [Pyrinomonadaceae bacterium]